MNWLRMNSLLSSLTWALISRTVDKGHHWRNDNIGRVPLIENPIFIKIDKLNAYIHNF